jgi:uncharacterized protein YycO/G:T-mismatch repair DNA endonuclease (very short patch repair protein)
MNKTYEFISKAIKIHGDKYDYSKVNYINAKTKVTIICKLHSEFEQTPDKHLQGGCKICGIFKCSNKRRSSNEEFIKKAIKIHGDKYDYSIVDYINTKTKIKIICKDHGIFEQTPHNHLTGYACIKCGLNKLSNLFKKSQDKFIKEAKVVHGDKYDYSLVNYINGKTKITIICKEHGMFEQLPSGHLSGKNCIKCMGVQLSTTEEFIEKANKIHGNKYDYSLVNYINNNVDINIICKVHGKFKQTPANHLKGNNCSKCKNVYKMNTSEFIEKSIQLYGDKFDYSDVIFIKMKLNINIICKEHGKFQQTPDAFLRGHNGCIKCSNIGFSKSQIKWLEFLEKYYNINIQHIGNSNQEYRIKNTKWKADGYCKETNTIYEYHGDFWHGNPKLYKSEDINNVSKRTMGTLYKRTINREQKIKDLGYNLITIWESDWNKVNKSILILQKKFRTYKSKCIIN